jgi:hypothetical protein
LENPNDRQAVRTTRPVTLAALGRRLVGEPKDDLPPGRYAISIRYAGTRNWERKSVYLRVK